MCATSSSSWASRLARYTCRGTPRSSTPLCIGLSVTAIGTSLPDDHKPGGGLLFLRCSVCRQELPLAGDLEQEFALPKVLGFDGERLGVLSALVIVVCGHALSQRPIDKKKSQRGVRPLGPHFTGSGGEDHSISAPNSPFVLTLRHYY